MFVRDQPNDALFFQKRVGLKYEECRTIPIFLSSVFNIAAMDKNNRLLDLLYQKWGLDRGRLGLLLGPRKEDARS